MTSTTNILVLGSGNFGTCLAYHLANERLSNNVIIYARDSHVVDTINKERYNPKYLSKYKLRDRISATTVLDKETFDKCTVVLSTIPTQHFRQIAMKIKGLLTAEHLFILANKGIESDTLDLPFKIVEDIFGEEISKRTVYLSGPSFASEVMTDQPTSVTVASLTPDRSKWATRVFHDPYFRVYSSEDVIGVEISGAIKNVIAIASGICTGVGYNMNTRAALLTRGLHEITKIGIKLGANPMTFLGLSGVGDLFLTCSSEKSRNFTVGYRLGMGEKLEDIVQSLGSVAEGVPTTKSAYELVKKLNVSCPIIEEVYNILYEGKKVEKAIDDLLNIEARREFQEMSHPKK
jgi:glycerol-3-phosphate dehydrogenase (NAD(P)+)